MLSQINTMLTNMLGPMGPLMVVGMLGVGLIIVALPTMLKSSLTAFAT